MNRVRILAAAALLALGGCDRLGLGGGGAGEDRASTNLAGGNAAASPSAAAPAAIPADAGVTTSRSFAGLGGATAGGAGGKDPAAAATPVGSPGSFAPAQLLCRWTDDGDCKHVVEFRDDGTFSTHTGGEGNWAVAGDTLILSGGGNTLRLRLQAVAEDAIVTVDEEGAAGRATRC